MAIIKVDNATASGYLASLSAQGAELENIFSIGRRHASVIAQSGAGSLANAVGDFESRAQQVNAKYQDILQFVSKTVSSLVSDTTDIDSHAAGMIV